VRWQPSARAPRKVTRERQPQAIRRHTAHGTPADSHHFDQGMGDSVSPRLPELDRVEGEDCLLDEIQCHASDIAGLSAIETNRPGRAAPRAGLLQSPPLDLDWVLIVCRLTLHRRRR